MNKQEVKFQPIFGGEEEKGTKQSPTLLKRKKKKKKINTTNKKQREADNTTSNLQEKDLGYLSGSCPACCQSLRAGEATERTTSTLRKQIGWKNIVDLFCLICKGEIAEINNKHDLLLPGVKNKGNGSLKKRVLAHGCVVCRQHGWLLLPQQPRRGKAAREDFARGGWAGARVGDQLQQEWWKCSPVWPSLPPSAVPPRAAPVHPAPGQPGGPQSSDGALYTQQRVHRNQVLH